MNKLERLIEQLKESNHSVLGENGFREVIMLEMQDADYISFKLETANRLWRQWKYGDHKNLEKFFLEFEQAGS